MTFKQGDAIWRGPYRVVGLIGEKTVLEGSTYDQAEQIPHSEALPAVAKWLNEWPGMPEVLASMFQDLAELPQWKYSQGNGLRGLAALIAALTGGEEGVGGG